MALAPTRAHEKRARPPSPSGRVLVVPVVPVAPVLPKDAYMPKRPKGPTAEERAVRAEEVARASAAQAAQAAQAAAGPDGALQQGAYLGEQLAVSEEERLQSEYTKKLIHGTASCKGIMRKINLSGKTNRPYPHQRQAVKQIIHENMSFFILGHDMGLGKTATFLQAIAGICVVLKRVPKIIISVPSATIEQWEEAIKNWLHNVRVLSTTVLKEITRAKMEGVDVILTSRDTIANAFGSCYSKQEIVRDTPYGPRRAVEWMRTPGKSLHPLFDPPNKPEKGWRGMYDGSGVDEAHYLRNPDSRWCQAHSALSLLCTRRVLMSGTFCVNQPLDLYGLCLAGQAPRNGTVDFQDKKVWAVDRNHRTVNRNTVRALQRAHINRATDKILRLPPMDGECVSYPVDVPPEFADTYNAVLADARNLKLRIERSGRGATVRDLQRLMALLQLMQQYVICPLLAQHGAAKFKTETHMFQEASEAPTGAFYALAAEIQVLRQARHRRIVVAANHVSILKIVALWIQREHPEFGTIFMYTGEETRKKRVKNKDTFLECDNGLLLLSIGAGGVGLHLVPGCEAMIFWGSMAFSPAHRRQCEKRIHRIGQECPLTGKVSIVHMVPYGSVDASIGKVHGDKDALIKFVQERDTSGFANDNDSTWRKCGRIVDECLLLADDGNFPSLPMCKSDERGKLTPEPYTLLPGVSTRGHTEELCREYYLAHKDDAPVAPVAEQQAAQMQALMQQAAVAAEDDAEPDQDEAPADEMMETIANIMGLDMQHPLVQQAHALAQNPGALGGVAIA